MLDIGWGELLVIGVVALIVVGPKDLPEMFRTLGRFTAKARAMARDFSRAMEAAADEAGVKDVAKDLRNVTSPKSMGLDALKDAATKFESWDPTRPAAPAKPTVTTGAGAAGAKEAAAAAVAARAAAPAADAAPAAETAAETAAAPQDKQDQA